MKSSANRIINLPKNEIMNKYISLITALIFSSAALYAQDIDTTGIYGERQDSLDAAVFVSRQAGNYLSKGKEIRT